MKKQQVNGQLSFDVVVETKVKTIDNKVVTQTSLFDLIVG